MAEPRILYETNDFLILDKPAGWVVNEAETVIGPTIQKWLKENEQTDKLTNYQLRNDAKNRQGIVHRLDKETSGVMVVAKTKMELDELQRQFKQRFTKKIYVALVHGKLEPTEGRMALPLGRSKVNRHKFAVRIDGKVAETGWEVMGWGEKDGVVFTLVRLLPKTGRTHQLRVHLAHIKHPMVADPTYLPSKKLRADLTWCPRLFLHARKLCFGYQGKKQCFESPLAGDLKKALFKLRIENDE